MSDATLPTPSLAPPDEFTPDTAVAALQSRLERAEMALRGVGLLTDAAAVGRAPKPVSLYALREMAVAGFRNSEIASHFGLTRGEFAAFLKENRRAASLLHFGRQQFTAKIENQLHENALLLRHKGSVLAMARKFGLLDRIDYELQ